jgi:hypothetical protein
VEKLPIFLKNAIFLPTAKNRKRKSGSGSEA